MRRGDCLELMQALDDNSVDMILCDLPYGTTACKWDSVIPFEPLWTQYRRVAKPNAAIVLTASQPFTSALVMSNRQEFAHAWVWDKGVGANFAQAGRMPLKTVEDVLVFCKSKKNPRYFPIKTVRETPMTKGVSSNKNSGEATGRIRGKAKDAFAGKVYEDAFPSSILKFSSRSADARGLHPTQKPVALMEYLIRTYTNQGDVVMDNCMGSGTTGVACGNLMRGFIGFEQDEKYFTLARDRVLAAFDDGLD